jgi:hypothetical protein
MLQQSQGKRPIQLLVQYKQPGNPLSSMHNYTLIVISGKNDKNKQLILLSQSKLELALTARSTLFVL